MPYYGEELIMAPGQLFEASGVTFGVEICEDMWVPTPPSNGMALQGAEIIFNLSATDEVTGKYNYLVNLIKGQSARCRCAYVYASAGAGESSTDMAFAGNCIIAEDGKLLERSDRFTLSSKRVIADIDIAALRHDRRKSGTYADNAKRASNGGGTTYSESDNYTTKELLKYRTFDATPFVDKDKTRLKERCEEISSIQAWGLATRLKAINCKTAVVGISGGLDSTLALLVTVKAFNMLGLDLKGIIAITMPGFGTTTRTHSNADTLMELLGVSKLEIPIGEAVKQHFGDIGHDINVHDVTYENGQARERTQILMDMANRHNGIVIGTGDLSELALGWCTYNGDQMSMYGVNASVPKTLVRYLVESYAELTDNADLRRVLLDIADTPISPELLPANADDSIEQKTEDLVGPYELHDFYLYRMLRYGDSPERILRFAIKAFEGKYDTETVYKWLRVFIRRFFAQQFKRSCMPDGVKVGSVCLSPRGDWRMPSDISSQIWIEAVDSEKLKIEDQD
jgi:NAD+ synthase (glutamine-hydrolysing)